MKELIANLKAELEASGPSDLYVKIHVADLGDAIAVLEAIEGERNAMKSSSIDSQCAGQIFMKHPLDKSTNI